MTSLRSGEGWSELRNLIAKLEKGFAIFLAACL